MTCLEARNLMLEALTGATPPDLRRALGSHLAECAVCRAEAALVEETMALLRALPRPRVTEEHWADFMASLQRRLEAQRDVGDRIRSWLRTPIHAWSTLAVTAALVVALGAALLVHPAPQVSEMPPPTDAQLHTYVTDGMRQAMPAMSASLAVWKAGLGASEVSYELTGGR